MDCPRVQLSKQEQKRHDTALLGKPDCANCSFSVNGAPNKPVLGIGNKNAKGLLLIEYPHKDDVDNGEPLVGLLGQQFDHILAGSSIPREHLFIAPAVACRPTKGRNEVQLRQAATACRPLLMHQLSVLDKDIPILAMGELTYFALTGKIKKVGNARGFLRPFRLP